MSNDDIYLKFSKILKEIRNERNLTQEDLAELCNLDRTCIGRIEQLKRKPKLGTVNQIAQGLDMSIVQLLSYNSISDK